MHLFCAGSAAVEPFWPCVCSWLFMWHVVWLSVMQLRHYLFIGTLNPMLDHLAFGNEHLGRAWWLGGRVSQAGGCGLVLCSDPASPQ